MVQPRVERKLVSVVVADVVGCSRLMELDEEGTHARLNALQRDLLKPKIRRRHVLACGHAVARRHPELIFLLHSCQRKRFAPWRNRQGKEHETMGTDHEYTLDRCRR